MDNEIIARKNWWQRNWKWVMPVGALALIFIILNVINIGGMPDFAQAYNDPELCQNAVDMANKNERVNTVLGTIEPIDKLAIMEGNAKYSNKGNAVDITARITGTKGSAKMDFSADKVAGKWQYKWIKIRIKKPEEQIRIVG